ncbi:hypothetical protein ACOME3_009794 [Neoechinorhynchus agilis]
MHSWFISNVIIGFILIVFGTVPGLCDRTNSQQQNVRAQQNQIRSLIRTRKFLAPYGFRTDEYTDALSKILRENNKSEDISQLDPGSADYFRHLAVAAVVLNKYNALASNSSTKLESPKSVPFRIPPKSNFKLRGSKYNWIVVANNTLIKFNMTMKNGSDDTSTQPDLRNRCTPYMIVCNDQIIDNSIEDYEYDAENKRLTVKKENINHDLLFYIYTKYNRTKLQHFFYVKIGPPLENVSFAQHNNEKATSAAKMAMFHPLLIIGLLVYTIAVGFI